MSAILVHIKDPLLLIRKNSPWSGSSWFPLSSKWSLTIIIFHTVYSIYNILIVSLNKTIPLFFSWNYRMGCSFFNVVSNESGCVLQVCTCWATVSTCTPWSRSRAGFCASSTASSSEPSTCRPSPTGVLARWQVCSSLYCSNIQVHRLVFRQDDRCVTAFTVVEHWFQPTECIFRYTGWCFGKMTGV